MSLVILNFHGVGPISRSLGEGERACWLDQRFFESILDLVRDHKHVRLTVDDGNESDYDVMLPALRRRNMRATFFVCSGRLDQPTFLLRRQVRELLAHEMTVGSHGAAHVPWRNLPPEQLKEELIGSRNALEEVCGVPISAASCPLGAYDRKVLQAVRQAGYREVYTSDDGTCSAHEWIKARNTVTRSMTLKYVEGLIHRSPIALYQSLVNARKLFKRLR